MRRCPQKPLGHHAAGLPSGRLGASAGKLRIQKNCYFLAQLLLEILILKLFLNSYYYCFEVIIIDLLFEIYS